MDVKLRTKLEKLLANSFKRRIEDALRESKPLDDKESAWIDFISSDLADSFNTRTRNILDDAASDAVKRIAECRAKDDYDCLCFHPWAFFLINELNYNLIDQVDFVVTEQLDGEDYEEDVFDAVIDAAGDIRDSVESQIHVFANVLLDSIIEDEGEESEEEDES